MVELSHSFERGDRIKVIYEVVEYHPGGMGSETKERKDIGEIIAKPSQKFNWPEDEFDFDYELEDGNAVRSVDIGSEKVCQLHYDAGGDRDWDMWTLISIEQLN